jgi:hypothetical protein
MIFQNKTLGFEVVTPVVMKSSTFWYIMPHSPQKVKRNFGGPFRLHLQGRKISQARNQCENSLQAELLTCYLHQGGFLLGSFLDLED